MHISVIGSGDEVPAHLYDLACACGSLIARAGHVLICGGRGGIMEAACKGAHETGGITVGILPTHDASSANPYVSVAVCTGMGELRNGIVVASGTMVLAFPGSYGTLSELAYAARWGKDIIVVCKDDFPVPIRDIPEHTPDPVIIIIGRDRIEPAVVVFNKITQAQWQHQETS